MAKLTESYLRNLIKKTINEMHNQRSFKDKIGTNIQDLVEFSNDLAQLMQSSKTDEELALDIEELVSRYLEDFAINPLVRVLANHLEEESKHLMTQTPEFSSEEEMEDFDLYESRKSRTTPKRK